jgi:hypothetical protein
VLAGVGERLAAFAAPLLPPDVTGRRPEADVPALAVDPPSGGPAPSFDRDIRPLFTARDRAAMRWSFDLWEVASVRQHAEAILDQVAAGRMPCYGPWSAEQVELFRRWVQAGGLD